ncbi:MAG: zf-HC2 domain-containing protein [Thiomonas sp.]|uniref:anti-sigma factor family protein n=1 Tax=Thiomonas sp. TaxID=2047785 RepID=UPI002A36C10D|nr:zf-HC2 domain-containing protein [Thiomonas sp.]MDY0329045.1 zf-HC2 domain-containing protein [Thiomonas sp.]
MTTQNHLTPAQIDHYRSGLATAEQAAQIEAHLKNCPQCQQELQFGQRLSHLLAPLPQLAARMPHRHPRTVRWPRVFAAGMATASLALAVFISVPHLMPRNEAYPGGLSPQIADAVQNIEFYQWLSNHPQMLQQGLQNGNPA